MFFNEIESIIEKKLSPKGRKEFEGNERQNGYYKFEKGYNSPKIYLLGRGIKSGKFKFKV